MNNLITIGFIGLKRCYLNTTQDEAIDRYCKSENITRQEFDAADISVDNLDFNDEFSAYDTWE